MSPTPEREYGRIFWTLTNQSAASERFRSLANKVSVPLYRETLRDAHQFVEWVRSHSQLDDILPGRNEFLRASGGAEALRRKLSESNLKGFQSTVDSAAVVFMHSALDAAVSDLCRLSMQVAPQAWEGRITTKTIPFSRLREASVEAIRVELLDRFFRKEFRREPLLARMDALVDVAKPADVEARFDRAKMARIDRLRHEIVHDLRSIRADEDAAQMLDFMARTGMFLWGLLNEAWDLKVDATPSEAGAAP